MVTILEIGDRVWFQPGGPIGLIVETRFHEVQKHQEALVEYYWGKSSWYESSKLVRTCLPLSK
ncbi:hypothetical protein [Nostoc sp. WHI]|uniref:hypothetical protein n=1 Tax=Nostoc sp. WHI TaxID=2650611 RepID=UPI0018C60FE4|nr:hypothetical protein [Nostoc sp. WHI]MBG1269869.1 hypothetical protein [Nostoc sp. WHI]